MSDHEFDALFRKAAENLEVPYNPKGWKRMQIRLNQAGGGSMIRRGLWGLGALLLLLGIGLGLSKVKTFDTQEVAPIELNTAHEVNLNETFPSIPKVTNLSKEDIAVAENQGEERKPLTASEATATQEEVIPKEKFVSPDKSSAEQIGLSLDHLQRLETVYGLQSLGITQEAWTLHEWTIQPVSMPEQELSPQEVIRSTKLPVQNRWGLSFGLSPDLSGIGLQNISHVGTKAKVQLEFFVLPNLSINSGVNFAVKTYSASPEDYHQKYQYSRKPIGINGQCKVLDIPINLRWYALNGRRSRAFVSGGLSSYMMLSEDYEYVYKGEGSYDGDTRNYAYKNKNNHLFKVANFSVGYEHALGKQWAVQAEPFVKVPLAGVGEGEMKLSTLGAFLSVHYRWGWRR